MMTPSELENLCRKIAPGDFGSRPLYVCFASEVPEPLKPSAATWGYTGPVLDLAFRCWLDEAGRWRGRGPAIVVNDTAIRADIAGWAAGDPDLGGELFRTRILATCLHELAHTLSMPIDYRRLPASVAQEIESSTRKTTEKWVAKSDENPWQHSVPAWMGHGAGFIRTLLHVVDRAYALGIERLPDSMIFVASNYDLSNLGHYRRALETELSAFTWRMTFDDLRTCRPPESFVDAWKQDLHDWVETQSDETAILTVVAALRPYIHPAG